MHKVIHAGIYRYIHANRGMILIAQMTQMTNTVGLQMNNHMTLSAMNLKANWL